MVMRGDQYRGNDDRKEHQPIKAERAIDCSNCPMYHKEVSGIMKQTNRCNDHSDEFSAFAVASASTSASALVAALGTGATSEGA